MNQQDFDGFTDIMQVVAESYSKRLSDGVIALYWQGLQEYDFAAVKEALGRHLRNPDTGQFMPKIADIMRMMQGTTQDAALVAWTKIDRAVRLVGTYQSVVFDDALIHRVLADMGGWVMLGAKTDGDWPFVAKEFEARYRGYKGRHERPEYPRVLVGLAEQHNTVSGHDLPQPVLIGNKIKAISVMDGGTQQALLEVVQIGQTKSFLERQAA